MDELQALIKELKELIAILKQKPTTTSDTPSGTTVIDDTPYPKDVVFDGVTFHLFRPINPKWKPSQYAKMYGKYQKLNDPSLETTPDGYPSRSPAGYPLIYPFVKDGKPYKDAVILYGENTFPNDAAVEEYIKASTPTAEDIERARKQWEEYERKKQEEADKRLHPENNPPASTGSDDPYIV